MNMRMPFRTLIPLALLAAAPVRAQMPVNEPLLETSSAHFRYLYQKSVAPLVPGLARDCEDAHALLAPVFHWKPRDPVIVLLSDDLDVHNGWATVYPRPTMRFYVHPTPPRSTIYEPGRELRRTVFHEFAHVLSLDAQYGFDAALAGLFGRVLPATAPDPLSLVIAFCAAPPGALAPTWFLEGLATWAETEFVGPGRGRNAFADMILRTAAADNRMLSAQQWDTHLPEWPYGNAPYLYGMRTMACAQDSAANAAGRNVPGDLADAVAHSFGCFFANESRPVTGRSFPRLAADARLREQERQRERLARLNAVPVTPLPRLTPRALAVERPVFAGRPERVYFVGHPEAGRDTLYAFDPATRELAALDAGRATAGAGTRLAATPDRLALLYTRLDAVGRDRVWQQLCRFDTRTGRMTRLVDASRYNLPALSPDGARLAAVRTEAGVQTLVEAPLADAGDRARERALAGPTSADMLIDPLYTPDGASLLYIRSDAASSAVHRVDLGSSRDDVLLRWPGIVVAPALDPAGRTLVFAADANGVYNLYAWPLGAAEAPRPLTHTVGGVFDPAFSTDGKRLAAVAFDSYGPYLTVLDLAAHQAPTQTLPRLEAVWPPNPSNAAARAAVEQRAPPDLTAPRPYNSFAGLRPDFWSPWLMASSDGAQGGAMASFGDPSGYQHLDAGIGWDTLYESPACWMNYAYAGWRPVLKLAGSVRPLVYPLLLRTGNGIYFDYEERVSALAVSADIPVPGLDRSWDVTFGARWADRSALDDADWLIHHIRYTPNNVFEGRETALFAAATYLDATAYGRSFSLEDGRLVQVTADHANASFGGDLTQTRLLGCWNEYLPVPALDNHVLKLSALYGRGAGDETAQGFFGLGGYLLTPAAATPGAGFSQALRGYDENWEVGEQVARVGASYRFPLIRMYYNSNATAPFYLQQIFGEVFYEGGRAWGGAARRDGDNPWLNALGAEINGAVTVFRVLDLAPGMGAVFAPQRTLRRTEDDPTPDKEQDTDIVVYISIKGAVNF